MRIFIGNETEKAMAILQINRFPFSETELKKNYKQLVFIYHPDRNNGSDESVKRTKQIINAYNKIKNLATPEPNEKEAVKIQEHYEKEKEDVFTFWEKCDRCNGTGRIITKKYIGEYLDYLFSSIKQKPKYEVNNCPKCRGAGEIKIEVFNPVIPKGGVMI